MSSAGFTLEGTVPASPSAPPRSGPDYFNELPPLIQAEVATEAGANYEDCNVTGGVEDEVAMQIEMEMSYAKEIGNDKDDGNPSLPSSQASSVSSSEMNEEELEMMINLIERQLQSEESLVEGGEEVSGIDEGCYDSTHFVEYWSVGKRGNAKTLLKSMKPSVSMKN